MRYLVSAVALFSFAAQAQDVDDNDGTDTTITVPGMQLNVKTRGPGPAPAPTPGARPPPPATIGVENFSIECAPMNGVQSQTIKVASPEGAGAQVWNEDGSLAGQYSVPFNFVGRSNTYYRFIVMTPDGQALLDRKLEVKQFIGCVVQMRGGARAPAPAPMPSPAGMPDGDFQALLAAVKDASFSNEKTGVVATAAQSFMFSVDQVGQLVDELSFSADKIKAVELTRRRLVDPQNSFKLLSHFTFSADKEKVQKLLK